jgi:Uma2 family endonuclease
MNDPKPAPILTYADFQRATANLPGRHELVDGQIVALASPSKPHGRLSVVLTNRLSAHLSGRPCDVYADTDVWTGRTTGGARRPDLSVTCDENDITNDDDVLRSPTLLIEILSDNMGEDLKDKLAEYQALQSVEEYIVLDSRKRWVRHCYRDAAGHLVFDHDYISGSVRLASIGYTLDIDSLYAEARIK